MRFLVDECCPKAVTEKLRAAGHDVLSVSESMSGVSDAQLQEAAVSQRRVIISEDFDFGELLIRDRQASVGAVILYMPNLRPEARAQRLIKVLEDESLGFENMVSIIEERRVRQRPIG